MSKKTENSTFFCENCGEFVHPVTNGSYRNHCPACLYSKHVDIVPGDRSHFCRALMKPVDLIYHSKKGWQIIHECISCRARQPNRIAIDTVQEDDLEMLIC